MQKLEYYYASFTIVILQLFFLYVLNLPKNDRMVHCIFLLLLPGHLLQKILYTIRKAMSCTLILRLYCHKQWIKLGSKFFFIFCDNDSSLIFFFKKNWDRVFIYITPFDFSVVGSFGPFTKNSKRSCTILIEDEWNWPFQKHDQFFFRYINFQLFYSRQHIPR